MDRRNLIIALPAVAAAVAGLALCLHGLVRKPPVISAVQAGALRSHTPAGMVLVPGAECWLGSDDPDADDDVKPKRSVYVPSYYIDIHEVTNEEFHRFDANHQFAAGQQTLPATHITYDQAAAYARWAGKRLPTEEEWEKAARGVDGRRYPWGNRWDPSRVVQRPQPGAAPLGPAPGGKFCFVGPTRTRPVGSIPAGASPYGCVDMAGNAWEWVQGFYNSNPDQRILRGGAVGYAERAFRTYNRAIEGSADT